MEETSTEDYEVVSKSTTEYRQNDRLIQGLLSCELALHLLALSLNCVLFLALRVYRGYHVHMRIFCRHITVTLAFSSLYSSIRTFYFLKDWQYGVNSYTDLNEDQGCGFVWQMPFYSVIVLCLFPIAIVVERNVATRNFNTYEHLENAKLLEFFCSFTYIPYPLMAIYYLTYMSSSRSSQIACEMQEQRLPSALRNIGQIILSIFTFICSKHFESLIEKNAAATKEYIENNYSSISPRYQLRENMFTCNLLLKLTRSLCLFCLLPVFVGMFLELEADQTVRLLQSAVWYLSSTPICLAFPVVVLFFDEKLLRRIPDFFKTTWVRLSSAPSYLPLCAANARNNTSSFTATTA